MQQQHLSWRTLTRLLQRRSCQCSVTCEAPAARLRMGDCQFALGPQQPTKPRFGADVIGERNPTEIAPHGASICRIHADVDRVNRVDFPQGRTLRIGALSSSARDMAGVEEQLPGKTK